MTAQDYIQTKLNNLSESVGIAVPADNEQLIETIFRLLMSKKFRKYAATPELQEHMKAAIRLNVEAGEPINLTFLHGAYKLWRLDESPEVDWAELFALMHYTNWVKPVCEVYGPGVWFDFFVDDYIVPKLNNVDLADIEAYIASYQRLMDFLKTYQPKNLRMTITAVGSRFASAQAFDDSLAASLRAYAADMGGKLPELSDSERASVELNTKVTDEQAKDPQWREKVIQLHNAYMRTKAEPGYHNQPTKIKVFTQPLPTGMVVAVGSTKDSVAKFWVGVGALLPRNDSFRQIVLSPSQLQTADYNWQEVRIDGLTGKNFTKVRVL